MEEDVSAGIHSITWNAEGLASGIYFCVLKASDYTEVKKLIFLK